MLKVTRELVSRDFADSVILVGTVKEGLPERERLDAQREIIRLSPKPAGGLVRKVLCLLLWKLRVFRTLWDMPVDMVNCHSLTALPLCVVLAIVHSCPLVYEPHELETETIDSRGLRRFVTKLVERLLIKRATRVITVSESIARWYEREYSLSSADAILNVPPRRTVEVVPGPHFRDSLGLGPDALVFIYQGVLWQDRGVLVLMEAFKRVEQYKHVVFMGFGPAEDQIKEAAASYPNIHFHGPVPPDEVVDYAARADVGVEPLIPASLSYTSTLSNKIFTYLQARLPVVVSDLPELSRLVDRYDCGWKVDNAVDSIVDLLSSLDKDSIEARSKGVDRAAEEFVWEREGSSMQTIYEEILS